MGKKIVAALFAAVGVAACAVAQTQDLAAVTLPGANIQRTMRLLEESAPLKRNISIIEHADLVLAFWDGQSRGTAFVIRKCREMNVPVKVFQPMP